MTALTSKLAIVLIAATIGLAVSVWVGTAAKVEADMGVFGAHLKTVFPVAGLSWLALMIIRYFLVDREAQRD